MTKFYNRSSEKENRRQLRNNMPRAEVILWQRLRGCQILNCKFRRQYSVAEYVIDFYSPEVKLAIEVDGDSHFQPGAERYDTKRQQYIESFGIKVLRFLNTDVYDNIDAVLDVVSREIGIRRDAKPQPPPAPPC